MQEQGTGMRQLSWTDVSRHKFYDERRLAVIRQSYSLDELRTMLHDWTWQRVVENTISAILENDGVYFHGRIGKFLARPAIAVCALDRIVVLRYVGVAAPLGNWLSTSVIDGTKSGGFALVASDFNVIGNIKMTDLVIGDDP